MAKEKRTPHKVVMTEGKREIIRGLLSEYDIHQKKIASFLYGKTGFKFYT